MTHGGHPPSQVSGKALAGLALGALGVVYGDIGTSPLYALKECFLGTHGVPLTRENILGVLSLVFWSLNFLISYKYIGHLMRADNRGEGGILALIALLRSESRSRVPGGLILLTILSINYVGDGLRDALDPRSDK